MKRTIWRASIMNGIFMYMFVLTSSTAGSKIIRTSAKSLAERAGAAQYAVHIEEELMSAEIGSDHKKRAIFDDSDYEIYQGVVGRPGIDFPIQASIPQTAFNCASFGNGYFADLETKCQVFHICEGGKKISFLCPNGTIFQQTDLICDWWFRVNCANSPDYYAESSEILTRSQNNNYKAAHDAESNKTIARGGHNQTPANSKLRTGHAFALRSSKHSPQSDHNYSAERFDVGDIYVSKTKDRNMHSRTSVRKLVKPSFNPVDLLESQVVAESASFVQGHNQKNSFLTQPIYVRNFEAENDTFTNTQNKGTGNIQTNFNIINYLHTGDRVNVTQRSSTTTTPPPTSTTTVQPIYRRGTVLYAKTIAQKDVMPSYTTPNQIQFSERNPNSKPRRLQKTHSTQYYTPTVPTILRRASTKAATTQSTNDAAVAASAAAAAADADERTKTTPSDHAIEMMRILNELMLGNRLLKHDAARSRSAGAEARSLALYFATGEDNSVANDDVPAAEKVKFDVDSTNALDVVVTISNVTTISNSLLSNATIRKYDKLFASTKDVEALSDVIAEPHGRSLNPATMSDRMDRIQDAETSGNRVLSEEQTPAIRSLAQVFTHALSAYLHDPTTFRQVLSEIRPTEPPTLDMQPTHSSRRPEPRFFRNDLHATTSSFVINTDDLEVLDFSDVTVSTQPTETSFPSTTPSTSIDDRTDFDDITDKPLQQLSRRPAVHYVATADHVPASRLLTDQLESNARTSRRKDGQSDARRNPLALEINGAFIVSTSFPYFQDDSLELVRKNTDADRALATTTTNRFDQAFDANAQGFFDQTTNTASASYPTTELPPPSPPNAEIETPVHNLEPLNLDDNDLQRSASASFVTAGGANQLLSIQSAALSLNAQAYATSTAQPTTAQHHQRGNVNAQRSTLAYTIFLDPLTINDELLQSSVTPSLHTYLPKSTISFGEPTTTTTTAIAAESTAFTHLTTTPEPHSGRRGKLTAPGAAAAAPATDAQFMDRMQERANEMFGGLNNTSAAHLMNVMRKANKNKTVRKLILLLIQTCDEDYSTTVEQSRSALLNALINMDSQFNDGIDVQVISPFKYRRGKSNTAIESSGSASADSATSSDAPSTQLDTTIVATTTTTPPLDYGIADTTTNAFEPIGNERTTTWEPFDYSTESSTLPPSLSQQQLFGTNVEFTKLDWSITTTTGYEESVETDAPASTTTSSPPTAGASVGDGGGDELPQTARSATATTSLPPPQLTTTRTNRHQAKRIVKDLDDLLGAGSQSYDPLMYRSLAEGNKRSDTRALDLLRSLYTLAGKLGK